MLRIFCKNITKGYNRAFEWTCLSDSMVYDEIEDYFLRMRHVESFFTGKVVWKGYSVRRL